MNKPVSDHGLASPVEPLSVARPIRFVLPSLWSASNGHWGGYYMAVAVDTLSIAMAFRAPIGALAVAIVCRLLFGLACEAWWRDAIPRTEQRARVAIALCAYLVIVLLEALSSMPGSASVWSAFPARPEWNAALQSAIDRGVDALTTQFASPFSGLTYCLNTLIVTLQGAIAAVPWPVAVVALSFFGWQKGGVKLLALVLATLAYFGVLGFWMKTIETIAVVLASFVVCLVIGIPAGIGAAKSRTVKAILIPLLDVMQTMPSFVYLLPAVAFFSIGKPPALISTVIFSMPPLIRLTCLGIEQVPVVAREAMAAHGATGWQSLVKAELPLAAASIRAGINQTIMLSLAMAVIASLIGAGGLGYDVLFALQNVQYGKGILAGTAIVLSAIVFDRLVRDQHAT